MAQGRFGAVADVLPPLAKRMQEFTVAAIRYAITQRDPALLNQARKLGLVIVKIDGESELYYLADGLE